MNAEETEGCPQWTYYGGSRARCGRPIKRSGMCGRHAAAAERVERNRQRTSERVAEIIAADRLRERRYSVGVNLAALLTQTTGLAWSGDHRGVTLGFEDAAQLLAERGVPVSIDPGDLQS